MSWKPKVGSVVKIYDRQCTQTISSGTVQAVKDDDRVVVRDDIRGTTTTYDLDRLGGEERQCPDGEDCVQECPGCDCMRVNHDVPKPGLYVDNQWPYWLKVRLK